MSDRWHQPRRHMTFAPMDDARRKSYSVATNATQDVEGAAKIATYSPPLVMPSAPRLRSIPLPFVPADFQNGYVTPPLSPAPSPLQGTSSLPSGTSNRYPLPQYESNLVVGRRAGASPFSNSLGLSLPPPGASDVDSAQFGNYQESFWPVPDSNYDEAGSSTKPVLQPKHRISTHRIDKETYYGGVDEWERISESENEREEVQHTAYRVHRKRPADSSASFDRARRRFR